jgi:hypothetical protein
MYDARSAVWKTVCRAMRLPGYAYFGPRGEVLAGVRIAIKLGDVAAGDIHTDAVAGQKHIDGCTAFKTLASVQTGCFGVENLRYH